MIAESELPNIGPGVFIGKNVQIGENSEVGANSVLMDNSIIKPFAKVGPLSVIEGVVVETGAEVCPGSIVRDRVPPHCRVSGNPAQNEGCASEELLKVTEDLQDYMQSRSRQFKAGRLTMLGIVTKYIGALDENDAANLYNMAFSVAWQQHEDFKADQYFIRELLIERMHKPTPKPEKAKGKVAWLINHAAVGTYAPYKHVHAYLSGMEPCPVYVHGSVRDKEANELHAMGHKVYQFKGQPSAVADAIAEQCKADEVGALIADIYTSIPLMVFNRRAAPLQVYLSPGFQLFPADLVLLPETQEVITHARHTTEFIPTCVLPEHLCRPKEVKAPTAFGVLSRAEKMSEEYLIAVGKICDILNAEFHIYGRGEPCYMHPRFRVKGIQNAHEALSNIKVYLDTYPTCGGLSCFEAMAHGIPVITLDHPSVSSWNLFKPCVKQTEDEFIAAAVRAYKDPAYSAEIATEGRGTVASRLTNIPRAVSALYKALGRHGWEA